ncbi:MAG: 23S rRNA (guanosine(2251)-2'-O)-methyltransferase RlmB [Candidatus Dormibacteraeota bacterium]|nr:23S rRNA (guanosine(2251)-2'-O)-methyltransferase RlmB [Candidatus Dormibacteraeota bacterium]
MPSGRRPPALVYGRNPVREALRAGTDVRRLLVQPSADAEPRLKELLQLAGERGIPVEEVGRHRLDDVAHSDSHQGVVAYVGRRRYWELGDLLAEVEPDPAPMLLVLDEVQDPQNLGSVARSAEAAGVAGVVMSRNRAPEITPAVAKASAGAVEHLRIAQVGSVAQAIERIREAGYWVVGLAGEGDADYTEARYDGRLALVVGSEGRGLHRLVRERCDQVVRLPMLGKVSSLNAAVAASIVMFEALRQRAVAKEK